MACLLLVSFPFVLLPLCLTISDDSHPHCKPREHAWHAETRAEGCTDRTVYGTSRTATTSFFTHHLRLISLAAVIGAALPVAIWAGHLGFWAKSRKSHLLSGAPLAGLLPVVM